MKTLIQQFGRLRLLAVALALLPLTVLPVLGALWLWQEGQFWVWLGIAALAGLLGLGLNQLAVGREQRRLPEAATEAAGHWSPEAEDCWKAVEAIAADVTPERYPLSDGSALMSLARDVLEQAARHFHPEVERPLLETTLPHTLAVIERAARELRITIGEHIPFSHQVSLGTMARARGWHDWYKRHERWFRATRAVVAPQSAVVAELRRLVGNQAFQHGSQRVQRWLLQEYVRKLGFHAIELYGGYARLDADSGDDNGDEALHIVVLGRRQAGKSRLAEALLGQSEAAARSAGEQPASVSLVDLDAEGGLKAELFDPGSEAAGDERDLDQTIDRADLILWVTAANRADRALERSQLDRIRARIEDRTRRAPPIIVVMSHIDQLRPFREWQPPYMLAPPSGSKAEQIVAALQAVAEDLAVPADTIVPVCLAQGREYNVDDAVWAAIFAHQADADRVRLLRRLQARQRDENWDQLWRQLRSSGRLLMQLPERFKPS